MADVLVLGPFVFDDWSTPDRLPGGVRQDLKVTRLPGGSRVIDCWGPDTPHRSWTGLMVGEGAEDDALTLTSLCAEGAELPLVNRIEARTVIIEDFNYVVKRGYIEYAIRLVTSDDEDGGGGGGFGLDGMIGADIASAVGLLP